LTCRKTLWPQGPCCGSKQNLLFDQGWMITNHFSRARKQSERMLQAKSFASTSDPQSTTGVATVPENNASTSGSSRPRDHAQRAPTSSPTRDGGKNSEGVSIKDNNSDPSRTYLSSSNRTSWRKWQHIPSLGYTGDEGLQHMQNGRGKYCSRSSEFLRVHANWRC
jgi:hypothetical protein